jgi:heparan-alpha-glucosaminide N-acetyltransferase
MKLQLGGWVCGWLVLAYKYVGRASSSVLTPFDCNEPLAELNRALLLADIDKSYVVRAVNSDCYKCLSTAITENCSTIWTPHTWTFELYNDGDQGGIPPLEVLNGLVFKEHGSYNLAVKIGESPVMVITVESEPRFGPNVPLYIMFGILFVVMLGSFLVGNSMHYWHHGSRDHATGVAVAASVASSTKERLASIDTFRGMSLCLMIFVNFGGGGYWFFDHATWNGLTVADCLFPWFMWLQGVSMALSYNSTAAKCVSSAAYRMGSKSERRLQDRTVRSLWSKACYRSTVLFGLGLFFANGHDLAAHWRVPGVLQYFAVSYFITSCVVIILLPTTNDHVQSWRSGCDRSAPHVGAPGARRAFLGFRMKDTGARCMLIAYRSEICVQSAIVIAYLAVTLFIKTPNCPRGYNGAGGLANFGSDPECTGGIHRYVDMALLGFKHIYHHPTCLEVYSCMPYDPEGVLGSLSASTLTFCGLMSGRVLIHFKDHRARVGRWVLMAVVYFLLAGALCGFSKDSGPVPINKNLWSTSFVFMNAGTGLVCLSVCYALVDWVKAFSGKPFLFCGLNSILIYCGHGVVAGYLPFSFDVDLSSHTNYLLMNVVGVTAWIMLAYYFWSIAFFVKI